MPKHRIHKFDFEKQGSHVALVGPVVGGPANQVTTLITKATADISDVDIQKAEVRLDISFRDFLVKFMGMWYGEAEQLCVLLGYEEGLNEWDMEWAEERIEGISLLKSAGDSQDISEYINSLEEKDFLKMLSAKDFIQKGLSASGGKPEDAPKEDVKKSSTLPKEEDNLMNEQEIAELRKAAEDAKTLQVELQKAKDALAEIEKAKEDKEKAELTTLIKSYSFIEEDSVEAVVSALSKSEGKDVILKSLQSAATAVEAVVTKAEGVDGDAQLPESDNLVADLIKQRFPK